MRKVAGLSVLVLAIFFTRTVHSGDDDEARAVITKAIKAAGGEEALKKHEAATWTEKGTYYGIGKPQPYTAQLAVQNPNYYRMTVKDENNKEIFSVVVNG